MGDNLEKRWSEHSGGKHEFDNVGLGLLIGFARKVNALDDFEYQILSALNEIRNSAVHEGEEETSLLVTPAVNAFSLFEVLARRWT